MDARPRAVGEHPRTAVGPDGPQQEQPRRSPVSQQNGDTCEGRQGGVEIHDTKAPTEGKEMVDGLQLLFGNERG